VLLIFIKPLDETPNLGSCCSLAVQEEPFKKLKKKRQKCTEHNTLLDFASARPVHDADPCRSAEKGGTSGTKSN